jgi:hypothetical protein
MDKSDGAFEESNRVETFQNATSFCGVLIIRRSEVRVLPLSPSKINKLVLVRD